MPNEPIRAAGTIIRVDGAIVAKITSAKRQDTLDEIETTGVEDTSGNLVQRQYIPAALGSTLALEGIIVSGAGETVPTELEPGQAALRAKMRAGAQAVIDHEKVTGFGQQLTGFVTNYEEGFDSVIAVWTFTGNFRINSETAIT